MRPSWYIILNFLYSSVLAFLFKKIQHFATQGWGLLKGHVTREGKINLRMPHIYPRKQSIVFYAVILAMTATNICREGVIELVEANRDKPLICVVRVLSYTYHRMSSYVPGQYPIALRELG
jgi:hypothetical protein